MVVAAIEQTNRNLYMYEPTAYQHTQWAYAHACLE